jgi:hypothetical protein
MVIVGEFVYLDATHAWGREVHSGAVDDEYIT